MAWVVYGLEGAECAVCDPCSICDGSLPCYGRGLSAEGARALALRDWKEAERRALQHIRLLVLDAGPAGITEAEIARKLGISPEGCDERERLVEPPSGAEA